MCYNNQGSDVLTFSKLDLTFPLYAVISGLLHNCCKTIAGTPILKDIGKKKTSRVNSYTRDYRVDRAKISTFYLM